MTYFLWLLKMTGDTLVFAWPATLFLAGAAVVLALRARAAGAMTRRTWTAAGIGFGWPVLVLLYGTVWRAGENWTPQPGAQYADMILLSVMLVQGLLVAFLVWRHRGRRWLFASWGLLQCFLTLATSFITSMSVSGRWL